MNKYNTKDRYEGLDPELAELLKQGKMIEGYAWNDEDEKQKVVLQDYAYFAEYPYQAILYESKAWHIFKNFKPSINKSKRTTTDVYKIYAAGLTLPVDIKVICEESEFGCFAGFMAGKAYVFKDGKKSELSNSNVISYDNMHTLEPVELP